MMTPEDDPQKPANTQPDGKSGNRRRGRRPGQNRPARAQNRAPHAPSTKPADPSTERAPDQPIPLPPTTGRKSPLGEQNQNRSNQPGRSPRQPGEAGAGKPPARGQNRPRQRQDGGSSTAENTRQQNRPQRQPGQAQTSKTGGRSQNRPQRRRTAPADSVAAPAATPATGRPNRPPTRRGPAQRAGRQQTSTRDRANNSTSFPPSVPRKAYGGIRARTENGEFGKNWWAKRWLLAMERLMDGARLQRGRRYARMGQVLSMSEDNAGIVAKVQGSRPQPYKVTIRVSPLTDEQWEKVLDVLADQAIFTAQLLAGEMPANIEEAFSTAGVSLFPARGGDLMTECSCPDWANPCKHIAATHYILGDRFDEDPFLIFRMRGRDQESILQGLRQRRAGQEEPAVEEPAPVEVEQPLDSDLAHFWEIGPGLEDYSVSVQPPQVELPLLKRLGQPDFARGLPLERELGPAYQAISQAALLLAFSDIPREPSENGNEPS